jgi:hypothetical protein
VGAMPLASRGIILASALFAGYVPASARFKERVTMRASQRSTCSRI